MTCVKAISPVIQSSWISHAEPLNKKKCFKSKTLNFTMAIADWEDRRMFACQRSLNPSNEQKQSLCFRAFGRIRTLCMRRKMMSWMNVSWHGHCSALLFLEAMNDNIPVRGDEFGAAATLHDAAVLLHGSWTGGVAWKHDRSEHRTTQNTQTP